jgi:hypothetical protein
MLARPRPLVSRRAGVAVALACAAVAASLLVPFILRQNAWIEWGNSLWLIERQAGSMRELGHPSYFLQTEATGAFYPQFLFYGGALFALAGGLAIAFGSAWAAYVAILVLAAAGAFGGTLWLGRQAGLGTGLASLPALAVATSPYAVTLLYGRGAWAEIVAVGALPLALAGAFAVVRGDRPWLGLAALAVAVAAVGGSHNITVVWGSLVCGAVVLVAVWALGPRGLGRPARGRLAITAGGLLLGGALVAWSLVPAAAYGRTTRAYIDGPGFLDSADEVDRLDVILRPYPYVPSSIGDVSPANYYQLPVYVLAWTAVVVGATLLRRRARRVDRRLAVGLWALLACLATLLVADPIWDVLPGLLTAIQFPLRLHAYVVLVTALLVIVALRMLRGRERQAAWVGALVVALSVQAGFAQYGAWNAPVFFGREQVHPGIFPAGFGEYQATMYRRGREGAIPRPGAEIGLAGLVADRLEVSEVAPPSPLYGTGVVASDVVGVRAPWTIAGYDRSGFAVLRSPPPGQGAALVVEPAHPWPVTLGTYLSLAALAIGLAGGGFLAARRLGRVVSGRARPA